jgi:Phospholipase_D-nuclease N-terminal
MARLFVFLFFAQIALAAVALISCLSAEEDEIRALPRLGWVLVILLLPVVGSIIWFYAGRPVAAEQAVEPAADAGWPAPTGRSERQKPRPIAPDDDPEFLRSLGRSLGRRPSHPADGASAQPDDGPAPAPDTDPEAGTDSPEDRRQG